ncbi:hypothetical protein [Nostoc sp.]|uniref:hypothetical protein n=1 Tax=Nostoc sp. TaxID=1180 RepID=UPI002FFCA5B9
MAIAVDLHPLDREMVHIFDLSYSYQMTSHALHFTSCTEVRTKHHVLTYFLLVLSAVQLTSIVAAIDTGVTSKVDASSLRVEAGCK